MFIRKDDLFSSDKIINVFTDASCSGNYTCAGAYYMIPDEYNNPYPVYKYTIFNGTNNEGELMAIYLGVQEIINFRNSILNGDEYSYNIFSDSLISLNSLLVWIKNWSIYSNNMQFYNSSNQLVKNQELIKNIARLIINNKINIAFLHIRGHMNPNNVTEKDIDGFYRQNGLYITKNCLSECFRRNNIVDKLTRNELEDHTLNMNKLEYPIISEFDKNMYNNYIKYIRKDW